MFLRKPLLFSFSSSKNYRQISFSFSFLVRLLKITRAAAATMMNRNATIGVLSDPVSPVLTTVFPPGLVAEDTTSNSTVIVDPSV